MDPLAEAARIEIESLTSWAAVPDHEKDTEETAKIDFTPLFPIRKDLNHKVYLW